MEGLVSHAILYIKYNIAWEKDGYQGYALLILGTLSYARGSYTSVVRVTLSYRIPGKAPFAVIAGSIPVHRKDGSQTVRRRRDRHVRGSIPLSHSELRSHLGISSAGRAADWRLELSASL